MKIKFSQKNNFIANHNRGFTLIEMMVATSIFIVIMIMAMGSLLTVSSSREKSQALRFAMDNVNFAMESMSRSIRTGTNYHCANSVPNNLSTLSPLDCPNGNIVLAFNPQESDGSSFIAYVKDSKNEGDFSSLQKYDSPSNTYTAMTSPEVNVKTLEFYVNGADPLDDKQPSVYILMKGEIMIGNESHSFAIQTMASQRNLE